MIEYRIQRPGCRRRKSGSYRLITTILDPEAASAKELAELYPQRWEIEITIKEVKRTLGRPKLVKVEA